MSQQSWFSFYSRLIGVIVTFSLAMQPACKSKLGQSAVQSESETTPCATADGCFEVKSMVWLTERVPEAAAKFLGVLDGSVAAISSPDLQSFLKVTSGSKAYGKYISWSVDFRQPFNKPVITPNAVDEAGVTYYSPTWYKGVALGPWIYIISSTFSVPSSRWDPKDPVTSRPDANNGIWKYRGRFARSLLENRTIPDATGNWEVSNYITDKTMQIVDANFTGAQAIARVREGVELLDTTASFIPGYSGASDFLTGQTAWQKGFGLIMFAADLVPLVGQVSKINNVIKIGANSFILIGATARLGRAAGDILQNKATTATAVDVIFAAVDGTFYMLTRVPMNFRLKSKVPVTDTAHLILAMEDGSPRPLAKVVDEATAAKVADVLGKRTAKDVLQDGLTPDDVLKLVAPDPASVRKEIQVLRQEVAKTVEKVAEDVPPATIAQRLIDERARAGRPIEVDIGGEGAHPDAINVNPGDLTSTTGTAGRPIPNHVFGQGENLPIPDHIADRIFVENAPVRAKAIAEMKRAIKSGGTVTLIHPADYAETIHPQVIAALGGTHQSTTTNAITTLVIQVP